MCHTCGGELCTSEGNNKQQNEKFLKLNGECPRGSCKSCWEKQERESLKKYVLSPYATPLISPTTSLSSSDRSFSSSSEFSVDGISYDRVNHEGAADSSNDDLSYRMSDQVLQLPSKCPVNGVDRSNTVIENGNYGVDGDVVREVDIVQNTNVLEAKGIGPEYDSKCSIGESGSSNPDDDLMDAKIWEPPESEDPEDDLESSVAYNDDDDDECGDGVNWGNPSSFSHSNDEGCGNYRFKEEKQRAMEEVINGKFKAIVSQLLKSAGVASPVEDGENWVDIVTSLSWEAASFLKLDGIDGKPMDPDGYVKVKCIATGSRSQSQVVKGLVFKKHAAHKHMPTKYKNPRLLLIQGVLGQSSSVLSSFKLMDQEKDHLNSVIEMIEMCHPNVVLVEKSVSRDVQESILSKGMTLIFDMKLHRLERVARCTGSQIVSSDTLMNQKLKQCDSFHIEKFIEEHAAVSEGGKQPTKTLMFLEGCPTRLGCTILLKGSHSDELKRVKYVVQCAVVMAYHLILETSFLVDQKAMFSTIPFAGVGEVIPTDQLSPALEIGNSSVPCLDDSSTETALIKIDSLVLNGLHEENSHVSRVLEYDKMVNGVSDGDYALSYEPYNPAIFTGLSSLSASLKKVIWKSFPIASATSRSLSAYLGLNGKESERILEEIPVLKVPDVCDHCNAESKGNSDETKSIEDGKTQSLSLCGDNLTDILIDDANEENQMQCKDDVNKVVDSQSILVLMSSRNASKGIVCEQSHFSHIMFYKNFDVPLGKFLKDNLLNQKSQCMTCGELPEAHFYYYAHNSRQLTIQVRRLPNGKQLPGEARGKLWMWSRCGKCKGRNGTPKSTKRVLICTAARGLSFGKFLELSFSHNSSMGSFSGCGHSLDRDFLYFFGSGPMIAMFKYSQVTTYTVSMPPQKLEFSNSIRGDWLEEELENVYAKGILLFREVANSLKRLKSQFIGSTIILQGLQKNFLDIEAMLKQEKLEFESGLGKNGKPEEDLPQLLNLNRIRWELLLLARIWDRRLHSLVLPAPAIVVTGIGEENAEWFKSKLDGAAGARDKEAKAKLENGHTVPDNCCDLPILSDKPVEGHEFSVKEIPVTGPPQDVEKQDDKYNISNIDEGIRIHAHSDACAVSASRHPSDDSYPPNKIPFSDSLQVDRITPVTVEYENNDHLDTNMSRKGSPHSISSSLERSSGWFWMPFWEIRQIHLNGLQRGYLPKFESVNNYTLEHLSTVCQLISEEGSRLHIPLGDNNCIVSDYEGEVSSIIACALALLKDIPVSAEIVDEDSRRESGVAAKAIESLHSISRIPTMTSSNWSLNGSSDSDAIQATLSISSEETGLSSFDGFNLLDSLSLPEGLSMEVSLGAGKSLGKSKYSVRCLYASQFRNLRNRCCPSEIDFIASLSRCRIWDAKGGKSKSLFAKTIDDRFIIKEIKKTEYDSFEKFAPHYFKYMNESFDLGNQTCLAKVLGIYQVTIRHPKSGKEIRHDLMVMENLTFGRKITRQYDLKGALHARFNSAADSSGDVLLDQNFVNDMNSCPLYVSNTAKRLLQRAVWNDTAFLYSINVMDYSLLLGVDTERRELVCGIIDYLRQYTWDKQLETWVKSSLVVPKNVLPTVISPKEYKKRFRKFMSTHFLSVPDDWCLQGSSEPHEDYHLSQYKSQKQGGINGFSS